MPCFVLRLHRGSSTKCQSLAATVNVVVNVVVDFVNGDDDRFIKSDKN